MTIKSDARGFPTTDRRTVDGATYDPVAGVNQSSNPKAYDSTVRALAGETVTYDEPKTNITPEIQGSAAHTPVGNPARYTNTEVSDPAIDVVVSDSLRNSSPITPDGRQGDTSGSGSTSRDAQRGLEQTQTDNDGDDGENDETRGMTVDELREKLGEDAVRGITGTGANGNVVRADLVKAYRSR